MTWTLLVPGIRLNLGSLGSLEKGARSQAAISCKVEVIRKSVQTTIIEFEQAGFYDKNEAEAPHTFRVTRS